MASGTIKRIARDKGFGFIRDNSGQEFFFHRSSVQGSFDGLNEGQRVSFDEEQSPKGPRAATSGPSNVVGEANRRKARVVGASRGSRASAGRVGARTRAGRSQGADATFVRTASTLFPSSRHRACRPPLRARRSSAPRARTCSRRCWRSSARRSRRSRRPSGALPPRQVRRRSRRSGAVP